jgi:Concanavalin A-like lectin/glucanases superfamily
MAGQTNGYVLDILIGGTATAPVPQLRFLVGPDSVASPATAPLVAGKFTHVAGVYQSGTGGTLSVYVNGARVAITTATAAAAPTSTLPLHIGSDSAGTTRFNGTIDETRLYNRALAPEEIQAIYRAGAAARCAP